MKNMPFALMSMMLLYSCLGISKKIRMGHDARGIDKNINAVLREQRSGDFDLLRLGLNV